MEPDYTREQLLERWQAKAGCIYSQRKARRYWRKLKPHLTEGQRRRLHTAWAHHRNGEGRGEIDEVCGQVRREWGPSISVEDALRTLPEIGQAARAKAAAIADRRVFREIMGKLRVDNPDQ